MALQQNAPRELFIDGYIAKTFEPLDTEAYHVSLLKREPGHIQWHTDDTDAFLAAPPPGLQDDWVIDYAVRDTGPVIRQKIWAPKNSSDKVRWVDHEQLHRPIFFILKNGRLGLPLTDAVVGNCMCLRGAEEAAPVGPGAHAQIRINVSSIFDVYSPDLMVRIYLSQWCGYLHLKWNEQISIQRQTQTEERETISLEKFANHVGKKVLKFMEVILILVSKRFPGN
jgi:hypothetical protein